MAKKFLSTVLTMLFILNLSVFSVSATPDYEQTKTLTAQDKVIDSVMRTEIPAALYDVSDSDAEVSYAGATGILTVPKGKKVSFTFTAPRAGVYRVALMSKTTGSNTTVTVGGAASEVTYSNSTVSKASGRFVMSSSSYYRDSVMGRYSFVQGTNTLTFTVAADAANSVTVKGVVIKYVGELGISATGANVIKMNDYLYATAPENINAETSPACATLNYITTAAYGTIKAPLTTFPTGKPAIFSLNVAESGIYRLKVYGKTDALSTSVTFKTGQDMSTLMTAVESASVALVNDSTETDAKIADFTGKELILAAGQQYLQINYKNVSGNSYIYFFTLERIGAFQSLEKLSVGGTVISNGSTIPRGTDTLELDFVRAVNGSTITADTVYLMKGTEKLAANLEVEDDKVYLTVNKTLDYGTGYTLYINGVADAYGTKAENISLSFTTGDSVSDSGSDSVTIDSKSNNYLAVTIKGKTLSSRGTAIEGRKIKVYVKDTANVTTTTPVYEGVSGSDGEFTVSYTLPDTYREISGIYTFLIESEYAQSAVPVEINYISASQESIILETLKDSSSVSDVESFLNSYATSFGLNPATELAGLDTDLVYNHFIGLEVSVAQDFRDAYYQAIALEKVNQAATTDAIEAVLTNSELCERLTLDKAKMDLIVNERDGFLAAVLGLSSQSNVENLAAAMNVVMNSSLAAEYGKTDVTSEAQNVNGYVGQSLSVSLEISAMQTNLEKLIYIFEASETSLFRGAVVTTAAGTVSTEQEGSKLTVTIVREDPTETLSDIGSIALVAPGEASTNDLTISGKLIFDEGIGYPIMTAIAPKTVSVTARSNTNEGSKGSSSYGYGNTDKAPIVSDGTDDGTEDGTTTGQTETVGIKSNFTDMASSVWAVNAVNNLFEKGIISDNEEKLFRPTDNVTREEFVKMIVVALGLVHDNYETTLSDVASNQWYYPYVASAVTNGIVFGDENGCFRIGENITRQDMAVIIVRVIDRLRHPYAQDGERFADDGDIAEYAKEAMYAARNMKIINGVGNNECAPRGFATRAMAAKVIYEMMRTVGLE